jgi:ABC-type lipoprotein release transport system permease subunit
MLSIKLAWRNLIGAGLRTWLNVFVLSLSFLIIIWFKGILAGWDRQARRDTIQQKIGGGEYWQENYDPLDIFTIEDAHAKLPPKMLQLQKTGQLTPVLIGQATIYPENRVQTILMKGITPEQKILDLPTQHLAKNSQAIPALIGRIMAKNNDLSVGDLVTIRWRDANGTFDADEIEIVHIFKTNVPTIDNGQVWIALDKAQKMLQMPGEATLTVTAQESGFQGKIPGWTFKDHDYLLQDIDDMIQMKSFGGYIMWLILLSLAWLAIFDTQVLSIFRRQKEIGTDIALGMTRGQVIKIFTMEGTMNGILAAILAALYGTPLLWLQAKYGFAMPEGSEGMGMALSEVIYPYYGIGMILVTSMITLISVVIVSFLPTRRIAKMNPTEAIRGKLQ